jgi:hypothetical protein
MSKTKIARWDELASAEPDLHRLAAETRWMAAHAGRNACANEIWYGFLKPQLEELVGWSRGYPRGVPPFEPSGGWPADNPLHGISFGDPEVVAHCDLVEASRYPATTETEATLRSESAYDVAYEYLYDLLPDCKHDGGCRG